MISSLINNIWLFFIFTYTNLLINFDSIQEMENNYIKIQPEQIWFFKPLDQLISFAYQIDKQYFVKLFQRKKLLISLLEQGKIDAKKYLNIIMKIHKTNQQLKQYAQVDLLQLTDKYNKNLQQWFKHKISQTKTLYNSQQNNYNFIKSQTNSVNMPKPSQTSQNITSPLHTQPINKPLQNNQSQQMNPNVNLIQFVNFKLIDTFLQRYHETAYKRFYIQIYQKKQKLITAVNSKALNGDKYYQLAQKVHNQSKSQEVKKVLKLDIEMLADLHEGNLQKWFNQNIIQTKQILPKQKQIYTKHINGVIVHKIQNNQEINLSNMTDQSSAEIDPKLCESFVVIDKYLQKNQQNPQLFVILYEKKKKMLDQVQKKILNPQKYQEVLKKAIKNAGENQKLKIYYEMELQNIKEIYEGNIKDWFQGLIQETKTNQMMQTQKYQELKQELKKAPKKVVKKQEPKIQKKQVVQQEHVDNGSTDPINLNFDISKVWSLKALDEGLLNFGENDGIFLKIFTQKKQIIDLIKSGKIDGKKYKGLQQKTMSQFQDNEMIKGEVELDLMNINDMFDGKVDQWFKQIIETSNFDYEDQLKRFNQLNNKAKNNAPTKIKNPVIQEKPQQKQVEKTHLLPYNVDKVYSLKVLDNILLEKGDNDKIFMKVFAQKLKLVDLYKNGKLDPKKYKALQQKTMAQCDNQQIKSDIQFDILQIDDMHGGDVQAWFQQIVQNTSIQLQDQMTKYQQLSAKNSLEQEKKSEKSKNIQFQSNLTKKSSQTNIQPPSSGELLCFTAIKDGFRTFSKKKQMIEMLNEKRDKFIGWIDASKLGAEKYITMCTKIYESTTNKWIKQKMESQKLQLEVQFNGDQQKWFSHLSKLLKQKPKGQFQSVLSQAQNQINQGSSKSKIRYFLTQMAVYQSLAKYFKNNGLNAAKHEILRIYLTVPRKDIEQTLQKIKTDPNFDVTSYCKKFLPPITQSVFHQDVITYQQKLNQYIASFNKQIQDLKQYEKKLIKTKNKKNFEKVKTKTEQCLANIKYLNDLVKNPQKLIPLPQLEEENVEHPNMDEFTHLQATEVELTILNFQNVDGDCIMKVSFLGHKIKQQHVHNGPSKIIIKGKTNETEMGNILKGENRCFTLQFYKKGWFSNTQLGHSSLQVQFIRSNIYQGKININGIDIVYESRVRMCKRPTLVPIKQYKLKKYPAYEHSKQVQKQFITKYTPSKK